MTNYAIIGASNNKEKFGYKVCLSLLELEEVIIPINPNEKEILGKKVYTSISEAITNDNAIDTAILIVPPVIGIKILNEIKDLNENGEFISVWFQPGSATKELVDFCKENVIDFVNGKCIMVEKDNVK